jgi:hypothetical protein
VPADATVDGIKTEIATVLNAEMVAYDAAYTATAYIVNAAPSTGYPFAYSVAVGGEFEDETSQGLDGLGTITDGGQMETTVIEIYHFIGQMDDGLPHLEAATDVWVRRYHAAFIKNSQLNSTVSRFRLMRWDKAIETLGDTTHYGIVLTGVAVSRPSLTIGA